MSLQTKILGLVISIIVGVVGVLAGVFAYWEKDATEEKMGQMALQAATTMSLMPTVKEAFQASEPSEILQPIALRIQEEVGAEFVVVGNTESIRYAHPDEWKIGKRMVGGDNARALLDGEYYISQATGSLGQSLRGKAPVMDDEGNIVGIISVGFLVEEINTATLDKFYDIAVISVGVLLLGIAGSFLLARSIRRDTLGLEPVQIASLYRDREAILSSVREGIIAIDADGMVTMMNQSAMRMLNSEEETTGKHIEDVFPNTQMIRVLKSGVEERDEEMVLHDNVVIVNRKPIMAEGKVIGVVASFRDKTEVREMVNALSEVKQYSQDLRAQTHEFANQMYVVLGLMQLGNVQEAIDLIQSEFQTSKGQNRVLFDQIEDETVQAILLGKISKASEQKVDFNLHEESSLRELPESISRASLVTILGNIIDNAFEAVSDSEEKWVSLSATDVGNEIVFEVADSGHGILEERLPYLFMRGFSTKSGENRGFGLANVNQIVEELGGTIEVGESSNGGAVFSVFIPKVREGE
ncbi:ATPase [Pontibacillus halophilus JSM 076056 = DSM 19796]|uniref:histidine kinase n=1 Tax=Pontibacillus halophilus JSM 076056 = DSM 19796 TaxID=1385510 RepID=A0A0A5GA84_9BACI|nr:sensor histidine kinase [Pontibacillus halophilus]KGX88103.1 ATPase [Pontibacillus halophilus JSM 076056 = DSM 19796]